MELIASIVVGSRTVVVLDALARVRCFFRWSALLRVLGDSGGWVGAVSSFSAGGSCLGQLSVGGSIILSWRLVSGISDVMCEVVKVWL